MIIVTNKEQAEFSIPRNSDYSGLFVMKIYSPVGLWAKEYDVVDDTSSKNFYTFSACFIDLPDGEFNYTLKQDGVDVATGIMRVGDGKADDYYIQYPFSMEYEEYYPNLESFIILDTEAHLPEEATEINYHVRTNFSWTLQVYIRHHTQSEWSPWPPENHTEKDYYGTIEIGPQVEDYPKHFKIVVTTNDGQSSAEQEITQDAHYYFTVDVFSPSSSISWDATELSYGIQYSEYQSSHTGRFLIYRNGELFLNQPFGWYPHGFSTYVQIPENSGNTPVTYTITGILDNEQSDTCVVTQKEKGPEATRLTFEMLEDGTISWDGYAYYDIIRDGVRDAGYQLHHTTNDLLAGDLVEFYVSSNYSSTQAPYPFSSTGKHNVYGNVMSLYYVDFEDVKECDRNGQFNSLFKDDTNLLNAENLVLPATTLAQSCYQSMFKNCTSLTKAPALPAIELTQTCYQFMFENCTSLTAAPELPAVTLVDFCYASMFAGCSNLSYVKCLAENGTTEHFSTTNWLNGVSNAGTFVKKRGVEYFWGENGIPANWEEEEIE